MNFDNRNIWKQSRDALAAVVVSLGSFVELGEMIARHIDIPKAIERW